MRQGPEDQVVIATASEGAAYAHEDGSRKRCAPSAKISGAPCKPNQGAARKHSAHS